ncbi:MAG: hypothetical protein FWB82_05040, partial [Treponema sp.]|nr:hypothetical protein [Treponema sp.]
MQRKQTAPSKTKLFRGQFKVTDYCSRLFQKGIRRYACGRQAGAPLASPALETITFFCYPYQMEPTETSQITQEFIDSLVVNEVRLMQKIAGELGINMGQVSTVVGLFAEGST